MALTATIFNVTVELSDVDRSVYETLQVKLAQHPSEAIEYMVARLLAYCFEYTEGIEFTQGLSSGDDPAILVRDLTGRITTWVEVGLPDADRLHRASKTGARVAVYTHRDPRLLMDQLEGKKIHRRGELEIFPLDRRFIADLAASLDRRSELSLSITEGHVYVGLGGKTLTSVVERIP